MDQAGLQLADLPGSAAAASQGGGDDDDSDKCGDEDVPMTFPQKMMEILSNDKLSDIITWLPHGRGFVILQKKRFANEIMPKFFNKKSKFTSFTRKLNRWNFTRVTRGPETGAYYHPLFQKNNLRLCMQMSCISSKSAQQLQPMNPVALGLAIPQPGQMGQTMVMPGDAENNFLRLRQLEEQRQNLLLQQQKQQQQLMALAGFGAAPSPGGAPGQVGSNPSVVPTSSGAPGPTPQQPQQPGISLAPNQIQQPPQPMPQHPGQNHGNPMAANPYIAMLMTNPQMMQINPQQVKAAPPQPGVPSHFNGVIAMPGPGMMPINPAMQAQFFAQQQQLQSMMQGQPPPQMMMQSGQMMHPPCQPQVVAQAPQVVAQSQIASQPVQQLSRQPQQVPPAQPQPQGRPPHQQLQQQPQHALPQEPVQVEQPQEQQSVQVQQPAQQQQPKVQQEQLPVQQPPQQQPPLVQQQHQQSPVQQQPVLVQQMASPPPMMAMAPVTEPSMVAKMAPVPKPEE